MVSRTELGDLIYRNDYHKFPGSSLGHLQIWLRDFEGLAIEAAQHGQGMMSQAVLDAKAADHLAVKAALAAKVASPEELTDTLVLELHQSPEESPEGASWSLWRRLRGCWYQYTRF
jgi:hypothetical protein